ncbi:MAG TPA: hypothetical protein VFP20_10025 [Bacteroidales bacterium]|nr:hypothetical protein [Bacteroidales bacterium]
MKHLLLFFAVVTLLTSCSVDSRDTTTVVNLNVSVQDWQINSDAANSNPLYYSYTFSMPEINSFVYGQGLVQAYIVFDGAQQPLPYVQHYQGTDGTNTWIWTRTIDFRYSPGELTVYVTNSDFFTDPPEAMNFRVVLVR